MKKIILDIYHAILRIRNRFWNRFLYLTYRFSLKLQYFSKKKYVMGNGIETINKHKELISSIDHEFNMIKKEFKGMADYYTLYQGLEIANILGARLTETRYEEYSLSKYLKDGDKILDVGSNTGFIGAYITYKYQTTIVDSIEHNKNLSNIGEHVAKYLGVETRNNFITAKFQNYQPTNVPYSVIFSFAVHYTDDGGHRVDLYDYFKRLHSLLGEKGILCFESHSKDIGSSSFEKTLKKIQDNGLFKIIERSLLEEDTRMYIVLVKE